jgi:hypothetical protein
MGATHSITELPNCQINYISEADLGQSWAYPFLYLLLPGNAKAGGLSGLSGGLISSLVDKCGCKTYNSPILRHF